MPIVNSAFGPLELRVTRGADSKHRLDGLNKRMGEWDLGYYGHIFNRDCEDLRM